MEKTISFWQHPDGSKVRILYLSPISWDNTLMADIDLNDESITQVIGYEENRHQIAKFNLEIYSDANIYRKFGHTGNDLAILHEACNIIEKSGNRYRSLQIHVRAALQYRYIYTDACGTTNDLDIQMEWHRLHDYEPMDNQVHAWICSHTKIAEILKQWAQEEGYDTAVNRNVDYEKKRNAVIVYIFKKSRPERNNEPFKRLQ